MCWIEVRRFICAHLEVGRYIGFGLKDKFYHNLCNKFQSKYYPYCRYVLRGTPPCFCHVKIFCHGSKNECNPAVQCTLSGFVRLSPSQHQRLTVMSSSGEFIYNVNANMILTGKLEDSFSQCRFRCLEWDWSFSRWPVRVECPAVALTSKTLEKYYVHFHTEIPPNDCCLKFRNADMWLATPQFKEAASEKQAKSNKAKIHHHVKAGRLFYYKKDSWIPVLSEVTEVKNSRVRHPESGSATLDTEHLTWRSKGSWTGGKKPTVKAEKNKKSTTNG